MSLRRTMVAGLVIAAGIPVPVASATYTDNPGPRAQDTTATMRMRVLRDQNAPDPPPVIAQSHAQPSPSDGGFPWVDVAIPAALVALIGASVGVERRRRVAAP
jgi:hypothetical protein